MGVCHSSVRDVNRPPPPTHPRRMVSPEGALVYRDAMYRSEVVEGEATLGAKMNAWSAARVAVHTKTWKTMTRRLVPHIFVSLHSLRDDAEREELNALSLVLCRMLVIHLGEGTRAALHVLGTTTPPPVLVVNAQRPVEMQALLSGVARGMVVRGTRPTHEDFCASTSELGEDEFHVVFFLVSGVHDVRAWCTTTTPIPPPANVHPVFLFGMRTVLPNSIAMSRPPEHVSLANITTFLRRNVGRDDPPVEAMANEVFIASTKRMVRRAREWMRQQQTRPAPSKTSSIEEVVREPSAVESRESRGVKWMSTATEMEDPHHITKSFTDMHI